MISRLIEAGKRLVRARAALADKLLYVAWRGLAGGPPASRMPRKPDPTQQTYWTPRREPLQPRERYEKQY